MKKKLFRAATVCALAIAGVCAAVSCAGCANCYTRCPGTDARIEGVYQPTKVALWASLVCAFPQAMSDCPSDHGPKAYNVLTIPLGLLVLGDALCESVVDTVFLPADSIVAKIRKAE